jgi:hypothetical protein
MLFEPLQARLWKHDSVVPLTSIHTHENLPQERGVVNPSLVSCPAVSSRAVSLELKHDHPSIATRHHVWDSGPTPRPRNDFRTRGLEPRAEPVFQSCFVSPWHDLPIIGTAIKWLASERRPGQVRPSIHLSSRDTLKGGTMRRLLRHAEFELARIRLLRFDIGLRWLIDSKEVEAYPLLGNRLLYFPLDPV